jgi:hypothetical protein
MIGLDAREASVDDWRAFAQAWREIQVDEIAASLARVMGVWPVAESGATTVAAGCGAFLVDDVAARVPALAGSPIRAYGTDAMHIATTRDRAAAGVNATWAQVCAPSVAVASLYAREQRRCG